MKRWIPLVVSVLLVAAWPVHAQGSGSLAQEPAIAVDEADAAEQPDWKDVRFAFKAGATWSNLRGEFEVPDFGAVGFTGDFGFTIGFAAEVPLTTRLSLEPGGYFVRKFAALDLGVDKNVLSQKLGVTYVEFPLLLKWYPGDRSGVHGHLVLGPMISFRWNATREIREAGDITDIDADDLVAPVDWSIMVGGGFEFDEIFGSLTVDVRYTHGFRNIGAPGSGTEGKWSVLQMVLGVIR